MLFPPARSRWCRCRDGWPRRRFTSIGGRWCAVSSGDAVGVSAIGTQPIRTVTISAWNRFMKQSLLLSSSERAGVSS